MSRAQLHCLFAVCILVLSIMSLWVFSGAVDEPFVIFRAADALLQVGTGMTVLTLWLLLAVVVCVAAARQVVARWWLLSLVWIALACAVVAPSPIGYVQDISRYVVR